MSAAEERLADDPRSELWGEHRSRYRFAAGYLRRGQRVLDIACGSGFGLRMLDAAGARTLGVDYDAGALGDIRRRQPTARVVRADALRLPLPTGSVDLVVSFETIEHVADARGLVVELRRVLKPGGSLVLSTPNARFGPPERHTNNPFHVREFSADELRALLAESFADVRLYGQRPSTAYRYVPFLMLGHDHAPSALVWKMQARLPFALKNRLALMLGGRPFYPGEDDYTFDADATECAHALLIVAR